MIAKLSKIVLVGGMALFFILSACFALAGVSWGINGLVVSIGVLIALGLVGTLGLVWLVGAAEGVFIRFMLIWQSIRRISAETSKQEFAADYYQINHPTAGSLAVGRDGRFFVLQPPTPAPTGPGGSPKDPEPVPEIEEPEVMEDVMEYIGDAQSLVLYGPQNSGKTTLLQHLIDYRAQTDAVLIIDPHGHPGKYPAGELVGAGRDYSSIDDTFLGLLSMMNERYLQYNGQNRYQPVSVCIDEYTLLNRSCDNTAAFIESALTEFRKIRIRVILCLHSKRAKFLGLAGGMDMAEGLIFCHLKKSGKNRWAEIENDGGDVIKCYLPGAYRGGRGGSSRTASGPGPSRHADTSQSHNAESWNSTGFGRDTGPRRDTVTGIPYHDGVETWAYYEEPKPRRVYESREEKTIVEMFVEGFSLNAIARKIWGASNGRRTRQLKNVLGEHGLV